MTQETFFSGFGRKAALAVAALCVSASAFAAIPFPNGGVLEANTQYSLEQTEMKASFTPSSTGTVQFTCNLGFHAFADKNCTIMLDEKHISYENLKQAEISVTDGQTIYFYCDAYDARFSIAGGIFEIMENQPIVINGYSQPQGSILSVTDGFGSFQVYANQPVHAGAVTLSITGTQYSKALVVSSLNAMTIEIPYKSAIDAWFNTGALKGGEDLTMTISGIVNGKGEKYNNGADLVLKFKAPQKTVSLRSAVVPDPFMSYWQPGNPAAILTATYTGDISKAQYFLNFGDQESEDRDYYEEFGSSTDPNSPAKVTIEGNVVKIDFAGKQRRPQDMVPSGTNYDNLTVKVIAWDSTGNPVAGEGAGQVGSFDRALNYQYIAPAELNTTFTPEPGGTLEGVKSITLRIYDYDKLSFDGVRFDIEGEVAAASAQKKAKGIVKTIIVPKSEITAVKGSSTDWTLTIPVPEEVQKTDSKVIVTLENLSSTDGIDHSNDIRAVYNGFTITSFELYNPEGQLITDYTMTELAADSKITVIPNIGREYPQLYMTYELLDIYNGQTESLKPEAWLNREDDGFDILYTQEIPMTFKLVRGHEYRLVFNAYPSEAERWAGAESLGEEYVVLTGASEPFSFSSIQFLGSDPENGSTIEPTLTEITLQYDGLVKISSETSFINYGSGMTEAFKAITPVDPEGDYANTWILTIPDSYIATYAPENLFLTIVATDENGKLVEGNEGFEDGNYMFFDFPIAGAAVRDDYYVLPAEGEVESLYEFTVGCDTETTGLSYNSEVAITLYDPMSRADLYTFTSNDMEVVSVPKEGVVIPPGIEEGNSDYYTTIVKFSLPNPITDEGTYWLNIPEGFFVFGSQFSTKKNAVRSIAYEIAGEPEPVEYTTVPAEGTVKSLDVVEIHFPEGPMMGNGHPSLSIDGGTPIVLNDPEMIIPEDFSDPSCTFVLTLPETYTANGTYEITFPKGFFQGMSGDLPAITLTYVIGQTGIDAVFGDVEVVNVFTFDGRQLVNNGTVEDIKALAPGFYLINGKKVVLK